MRLPPSVRYFPSRLQVIWNPWLWLGLLVTGIVGVYAWEYRQNPGQLPWQIGSTGLGSSGDATSTDVLLESLTPEEQAVAAELDNIELLLAQLDSDISALTSGGEASAAASLNAALGNAEPSESGVERLTRYVNEYSFLGTQARGANVETETNDVLVQRPTESILNLRPATPTENTLSDALGRQQPQPTLSPSIGVEESPTAVEPDSETTAPLDETPDLATPTFAFDQTGVIPGSVDGLNQPFLRTTPNMSPPPGTTGYVPPASLPVFNQQNQSAGIAPVPAQPSSGAVLLPTVPDRSQALPPANTTNTAPLEIPTLGSSSQPELEQPRNAWESFWD